MEYFVNSSPSRVNSEGLGVHKQVSNGPGLEDLGSFKRPRPFLYEGVLFEPLFLGERSKSMGQIFLGTLLILFVQSL